MLAKRIVAPLSVPAVGSAAAVAGVLNAAEATGCSVTYFGDVRIKNTGGTNIDGWKLAFAFPSGRLPAGGGNGSGHRSGAQISVTDAGWNRTIAPGATVTVGFNGGWSEGNAIPTVFTVNGMICGAVASPAASFSSSPSVMPSPSVSKTPAASQGAEIFTGSGRLDTSAYSVKIA
ncbi:hypothetical protein Aph02nite_73850 [Actinoplanes philippinensis]|uniref:Endoglucanase n=1 Tax=Actinoplanes philippinensis TaxID=35752 RepID=A0A1I2K5P3_9ACTN|nr:cellulose binding domain-containing protein [Actinoplanes philippinensis]GIE81435.1 hypothetical protein Aph02nite_73850 [Actinoplanes philippinensis]SFF61490.1 endoglucanase [Actinoplanes philippinensis]